MVPEIKNETATDDVVQQKQQQVASTTTTTTTKKTAEKNLMEVVPEDNDIPDLADATPDNSAQSTLTSDEARELKEAFLGNRFQAEMAEAFSTLKASKRTSLHKRVGSAPVLSLQDAFAQY